MTREEIFTEFVKHLSQQNARASESSNPENGCVYRAQDEAGRTYKCAVGLFIPDIAYMPSMEGKSAGVIVHDYVTGLPEWMPQQAGFLSELQSFHDTLSGSIFKHWTSDQREDVQKRLLDFAEKHALPTQAVFDHFPVNPPA